MANEANSRETVPNFRWGETAGGASVSANVVEPPSGQKDVGWAPGDGLVAEWWNFCAWAARVAFRYLENAFGLGLLDNHVMAGAAGTEGVITNGAGLTVNVSSARCWIGGAMYTVPAATNLALAAADPSNDRLDLVYAHTTGSPAVPSYAVVTGTPSGTLPLPTPALPAGGCAIGTVKVAAAASSPSTKVSLREFGRLSLDRLIARDRLDVGDVTGTPVVTILNESGLRNGLTVGDPLDPPLQVNPQLDVITVKPEAVTFSTAITRKFDMHASHFRLINVGGGAATQTPPQITPSLTGGYWEGDGADEGQLVGAVRIPNGAHITGFRVYGTRADNARGLSVTLWKVDKTTNAPSVVGIVDNLSTGSSGDFSLVKSGLSSVVDQTDTYSFVVSFVGSGVLQFWSAEVTYTETNPFDSL